MTYPGTSGQRPDYPQAYKDFWIHLNHGRFYGFPNFLDPDEINGKGLLISHPAVLSAPSRAEVEARIDGLPSDWYQRVPAGSCGEYDLVRYRGTFFGLPRKAGPVDLDDEEDCRLAGILVGESCEELRERIGWGAGAAPVEFAGWLPIYEVSGNCGRHPQFTHTAEPPEGYRFTCSAPPRKKGHPAWRKRLGKLFQKAGRAARVVRQLFRPLTSLFPVGPENGPRVGFRVLGAMGRLFCKLLWNGAGLRPTLRFLLSRHYQSQLLLARSRGLVFLTSMPYTYNQNPWVIEIEDPTTLFFPLVQNGATYHQQLRDSPYFPVIKTLLESDQCRGILTHMKSTAALVPALFNSEKIRAKVRYTPLGVPLPERWQRHEESEHLNLVFINSWCQVPGNLYVRGGLDVLEAFAILHRRYPHLRLTLRTRLPYFDHHYHRLIENSWVRVIDRFLTPEELSGLLADSHVFLLPSARIHVVSLLEAMAHGLAVVTSDGWGIEEYVTHERNGLIVKGRYGKVSWVDEQAGMLREDYEPMYTPDPQYVGRLVEAVSRLVEDPELRRRLGRTARGDVETTYNLERWNRGLKEALDEAQLPGSGPRPVIIGPTTFGEEILRPAVGPEWQRAPGETVLR